MSKTLFDLRRGTSELNIEQGNRPDKTDKFIFGYLENIGIELSGLRLYDRDVSTDTIWGGFTWGDANWDGSYDNSRQLVYVLNPLGTFHEHFVDDEFINTSASTATISLGSSGSITIGDTDVLESEIVHNDGNNVTEISFYINENLVTNSDNLKVEVSTDGGSNYETVTTNGSHLMNTANVGKNVRYKLSNTGTSDIVIDTSYSTNNKIISIDIN